ncbi:MAG: DUF2867 domain-containing protein [Jatrophihabitans sp.]
MTVTHQLAPAGYTDLRVESAPGAADRSAIDWARAILEGAPAALRAGLTPGWAALRLGLASRHAPDHVLGWPVVVDTPAEVVLGAHSKLGLDARLSIRIDDDTVQFATAIRFLSRGGRTVWTGVAPLHRLIVGQLLRHAVEPVG